MSDSPSDTPTSESDREILNEFDRAVDDQDLDPIEVLASLISGGSRKPILADALRMQGQGIAGYSLIRLVGIGGMGATYEALSADGTKVAVKIVGALSEEQKERFQSECSILKRLRHPGIVRYLEHGILKTGNGFLVMDFVEGLSLQRLLDECWSHDIRSTIASRMTDGIHESTPTESPSYQRRMDRLLAKVADALALAHDAGLIHRDIKPANILVGEDLEPVLIDFGLGRDLFRSVSLTQSGAVMGTLTYMSPEQLAEAEPEIDQRADVFALGLLLYRALVGRDLRESAKAVLRYGDRGLVLEESRELSPKIQAILYKCLDPHPRKRYPQARDLAEDLHATLGSGSIVAKKPHRLVLLMRRPGAKLWAAVLCCLILAIVAILFRPADPHLLRVSVLNDGGDLFLDGAGPVKTPHPPFEVAPGHHTLEYRSQFAPTIRRNLEIQDGGRFHALNLLTISHNYPVETSHSQYSGDPFSLLLIETGDPLAQIFVDGTRIAGPRRWIRLKPGAHRLKAISEPNAIEEEQTIDIRPNELTPAFLLPRELSHVRGDYRLTLSSVLSPIPQGKHVTYRFGNGAVPFMNEGRERRTKKEIRQLLRLHTSITSVNANQWAVATLRIDFDKVMKSMVFYANHQYDKASAEMQVDYSTRLDEWQQLAPGLEGHLTQARVPRKGTKVFILRARIRVKQEPLTWATARFLASYIDNPANPVPAFAIVADPKPHVATLK